jgi:hypothetical protein
VDEMESSVDEFEGQTLAGACHLVSKGVDLPSGSIIPNL